MKEWDRMFGGKELSDEMVLGRDLEIISGDTYFYRSWDAAKMYMKDFAFSQQHNLSVSGQQGKTNYYIGLGYMGQGGVIKVNPDEYDYIYYTYGMQLYKNMPLIEPLEYQDMNKIHDFVIAIDTSGSCQGRIVRSFLTEAIEYTFCQLKVRSVRSITHNKVLI